MPLFSIITVTYNAVASLRRTLSSVSSQTFRDVEHIFIDGVSTDGTLNILNDYRSRYGSDYAICVFSEPDNGLYDAMNKGLRRASGQYLVFLNAGDSLADNHTLAHLATLAGGQPAVIYGDTLWTDEEGIVIGSRNHSAPKHLDWKSFRNGMLVCHQAFYARREIAQNVQYDTSYRFSADVDWCIRVMKEASVRDMQLANANEVIALYQREGATTSHHRASLLERFRIMCRHYGLIPTCLMHLWFVVRGIARKL